MEFLLLPVLKESEEVDRLSLYSLKHKKPYNHEILQNVEHLRCVGSWHGWLAFLDHHSNPFLLNLISPSQQIPLPPKKTLPHPKSNNSTILKILISPHAAVAIYTPWLETRIAFCRKGDQKWRPLHGTYYDAVFCHDRNTLFALGPGPRVDSWDLTLTNPKSKTIIENSCPKTLELALQEFPTDLYSSQWYLALSPGREIYLMVRYIGEFVRHDGAVVHEGDTLTDEAAEPLICPYKTVSFRVMKVEVDGREWRDVESLNGCAVFVGGCESVMVESDELKRNSIYFTDDYWERMEEDYNYGGHDMGVYSMDDGTIQGVVEDLQTRKIQPSPLWISLPPHSPIIVNLGKQVLKDCN